MIRPDFRNFKLEHSAKGSTWDDHKYVKKIDGVYYYPVGYEDGRTVDNLYDDKKDDKTDNDKTTNSTTIDDIKNHFDQYLAKRGIDWRTLPAEEVAQMQRDIIKQLENNKETGTSEKTADELARDIISGKFGSKEDQKKLLGDRYLEIQKKIDEIVNGSTGSKKVSEASDESIKKAEAAAKKASTSSSKNSKVHSGVDMNKVQSVYKKKK